MAADPARRYDTAAAMAADLRACLDGRSTAMTSFEPAPAATARAVIAESVDRRLLAIAFGAGTVLVLDAMTGTQLAHVAGDGSPVERLTFDANSRLTIARFGGRVENVAIAPIA